MIRRRRLPHALGALLLAAPAGAQPSRNAPAPPLPLPAGMAPLPHGAYRVQFRAGQTELAEPTRATLAEIGRRLALLPEGRGRITIEGQASGPANDASMARRIALARATAVRAAVVAGGLAQTRVDVRALGRTPAALDCADVLPPEARSGGAGRRP
jgi:outer membrane protein OmpA-like peptidoglycan-associated protein